jgi:stage II sporulation protein D
MPAVPRRLAATVAALTAGLLSLPMTVPTAPAAAAAEVHPRPATGVLQVTGHGYGHGRGMSQWGAAGAATTGLTYDRILGFYYAGTKLESKTPESAMRVWISADTDNITQVQPVSGLRLTTAHGTHVLPTAVGGAAVTGWRARRVASGELRVEWLSGADGRWAAYAPVTAAGAQVDFSRTGNGEITIVLPKGARRTVRERVRAVKAPGSSLTAVRTVAVMSMTSYLRSVVPAEMPASWPAEALKAQSVAARTYAARLREARPKSQPWDVCDTVSCQVFSGTSTEHARSDAAVTATAGRYLTRDGALVMTEFSASNGGWSVSAGSRYPHMVAKADPYDGVVERFGSMVSTHAWSATVSMATLEKAYPAAGRIGSVQVLERDGNGAWGGRVRSVRIVGAKGSVTVSGDAFKAAAGLRSVWWTPRWSGLQHDLTSDGQADLMARGPKGRLAIFAGTGVGTLSAPVTFGSGWQAMSSVVMPGDLDGDGRADALAVHATTGDLRLYPGTGAGRFTAARRVATGWQVYSHVIAAGDWSGDGLPDVLTVHRKDGRLRLHRGTGNGTFAAPVVNGTGWAGFDLITGVGDIDGDGRPELVARVRRGGALRIYSANGSGGFTSARPTLGTGWAPMSDLVGVGDISGDGRPDLLAVHGGTGRLWLYPGTGALSFGPGKALTGGWKARDIW